MKLTQLTLAAALGSMALIPTESNALGISICKKASIWKGNFSIRSFGGKLCKIKLIASWAAHKCANVEDFYQSDCAENIVKVLGLPKDHFDNSRSEQMEILEEEGIDLPPDNAVEGILEDKADY